MVFGKGINDLSSKLASYSVWHSMLRRCYSEVYHKTKPTYIGVEVQPDWLYLSNFHSWFVLNHVEDWHLDKDLLGGDKRIYSEDTCTFLPSEINSALQTDKLSTNLPPGVSYKTSHAKYVAQLSTNNEGTRKNIHLIIHDDPMVCFAAYKEAKENYLKTLAEKYKYELKYESYQALLAFSVKLI